MKKFFRLGLFLFLCAMLVMGGSFPGKVSAASNSSNTASVASKSVSIASWWEDSVVVPDLPANFDPEKATDEQLNFYSFPRRPDKKQFPDRYEEWKKVVSLKWNKPSLKKGKAKATTSNFDPHWSGYDVQDTTKPIGEGPYREVVGYWTVPTVIPEGFATMETSWVGLGGIGTPLIQAGTTADINNNAPEYYGFFEIVGDFDNSGYDYTGGLDTGSMVHIEHSNLNVRAGDAMYGDVWLTLNSNGTADVNFYLANLTTGNAISINTYWYSFLENKSYYLTGMKDWQSTTTSAEWIDERPVRNWTEPFPNLSKYATIPWHGAKAGLDFSHLLPITSADPHLNMQVTNGMDCTATNLSTGKCSNYIWNTTRVLQAPWSWDDTVGGFIDYWHMYC